MCQSSNTFIITQSYKKGCKDDQHLYRLAIYAKILYDAMRHKGIDIKLWIISLHFMHKTDSSSAPGL